MQKKGKIAFSAEALIKSPWPRQRICGMGCKEGDEVNGHSLDEEHDTADRPQSPVPEGCAKNTRLLRCTTQYPTSWLRTASTTGVVRLAIITFLGATRFMRI